MGILKEYRHILFSGILLAVLVFALKWMQWRFLILDNSVEIYAGLIAVFFTLLGIWLATQLVKDKVKEVVVFKEIPADPSREFQANEQELEKLGLTGRELETLHLIAKGHSNTEIADLLCLSLSTVKTHLSNLYVKLDVKRRTQAIEKAKRLRIIP